MENQYPKKYKISKHKTEIVGKAFPEELILINYLKLNKHIKKFLKTKVLKLTLCTKYEHTNNI